VNQSCAAVWEIPDPYPNWAGTMNTDGGLIFYGSLGAGRQPGLRHVFVVGGVDPPPPAMRAVAVGGYCHRAEFIAPMIGSSSRRKIRVGWLGGGVSPKKPGAQADWLRED
jgi:hypothetical protein